MFNNYNEYTSYVSEIFQKGGINELEENGLVVLDEDEEQNAKINFEPIFDEITYRVLTEKEFEENKENLTTLE